MIYEQSHLVEPSLYNRIHSPIVDDAENQDESIKNAINHVVKAYNEGKKVTFIVEEEVTVQELLRLEHY